MRSGYLYTIRITPEEIQVLLGGDPYCYDTVVFVVGAMTSVRYVRDWFRSPDLNGLRPRLRLLASGHNPIHPNLLEWGHAR